LRKGTVESHRRELSFPERKAKKIISEERVKLQTRVMGEGKK